MDGSTAQAHVTRLSFCFHSLAHGLANISGHKDYTGGAEYIKLCAQHTVVDFQGVILTDVTFTYRAGFGT